MRSESYDDAAMEELAAARDSDKLCRLLVQAPLGWGSSTRHGEAVSLLRGLSGGALPGSLVALLLCTCRRWDRVTAKLIAAVEECGVLSGPDLDELAESLLSDEVVAVFPLSWISAQWLEFGTADGTTRTVQVSDEAMARDERRVEPPLRRWAAARALRNDPARLEELLARADGMRRVIVTRCCMACSMPPSPPKATSGWPGAEQQMTPSQPIFSQWSAGAPCLQSRRGVDESATTRYTRNHCRATVIASDTFRTLFR